MFLDLEFEARTNGQFQDRLRLLQAQVEQWHRRSLNDEGHLIRYHEAVLELIRFCRFNFVFLTPFFWPKFRGAPLTFGDYPFAWSLFQLQFGGFTVVRASRQIGKSTALSARQHILAELIPGFKSTYIVPHYKQLQTYCNRTREIERAMVGFSAKRTGDLRKNLAFKEFPNGSTIEMHNVLTSALPVRGMSADELVFDEAQDFDPDLEIEVTQIQAASHMAVTVYAGTSLTTDTLLEKKYSESSQGVWVTRCPACGHDNIPLPDHGVLDSIQPMGPACCKCSRPIDVRTGRFIHADTNKLNAGHVGLHVPQIILPAVVNNPVRWGKIYEMKLKQAGNRKFLQEILGIAVEEGEREITKKNLMDICVLGRDFNALLRKVQQRDYEFVVSGCDWGGSDYIPAQHIKISTTVHVVVGVLPTGKLDILHIQRYSGMNYDDIVNDIMHNHSVRNGFAIASDFGVGAGYSSKIREKLPPEKHLIFGYVGPASDLISEPKQAHIYNQWSLNKTESLSLTYEAIRQQRIRCFDWAIAEEFLSDFLNIFRAPGESPGGATTFIYRAHPSKPNDTAMAINYAFMLAKILLKEPMFADSSLKSRLEQTFHSGLDYSSASFPGHISG